MTPVCKNDTHLNDTYQNDTHLNDTYQNNTHNKGTGKMALIKRHLVRWHSSEHQSA
jgi:hypothetical protein